MSCAALNLLQKIGSPLWGAVFKEADHEEVHTTMQQDSPMRDDDGLQEEIIHLNELQGLMQRELMYEARADKAHIDKAHADEAHAHARLFFASYFSDKEAIAAKFPETIQAQLPMPPSESNRVSNQ